MLKSERHQLILQQLQEAQFVRLEELTQLLETSESTVRRDLDELEAAGRLRRVHGGAELPSRLNTEESIAQKSTKNVHEKQALAVAAIELVETGDVIYLDAGTTTELMIPLLPTEGVTVVTNSIHHAAKLVDRGIRTVILGGFVKEKTDASIGAFALEQIGYLQFDKAFLGMNGVTAKGLTTPDIEEATIKRCALQHSKECFVLADSSKVQQVSFVKVAEVSQCVLITTASESSCLQEIKEKTRVIAV